MEEIIIASDHAAYEVKENLKKYLEKNYFVIDLGTHSSESVHYPKYAIELARKIKEKNTRGILLCGSGIGMSMVANRFKGIRAALCRTEEDAKLSRMHNNSNVLCIGGRMSTEEEIKKITDLWLSTDFEGGRHAQRVAMFDELGEA